MDKAESNTPSGPIFNEVGRQYFEGRKRKANERKQATAAALAVFRSTATPYPVEALGQVLSGAVWAIEQKVQCAPAMAANSVLGVSSLAAQAKADVQLPTGQTKPLSLFIATIAEFGDRKTATDTEAMKAVRAREFKLSKAYKERLSVYKRKRDAWKFAHDKILKGATPLEIKEEQLQLLGDEPAAPRLPKLTLQVATEEGVIKGFAQMPPAIGIFSSEGAQFLTGHGFTPEKKAASGGTFSSLWDGGDISRGRAGDGLIFMERKTARGSRDDPAGDRQ